MTKDRREKPGKPTIRTVAEHVDLSPATVSLALRGDQSIPFDTRQRVLKAAEELNYDYKPRSQQGDRTVTRIAFVAKDYGDYPMTLNPFYGQTLHGVELRCRVEKVDLSFVTLPQGFRESSPLPPALSQNLDGILLASPYPNWALDRLRRETGARIVLVDHSLPGQPYDSVMADDFGGGFQATQYLLEHGHTEIVAVTGKTPQPGPIPDFELRYWGYCAGCREVGVTPRPAAVLPSAANDFDNEHRGQALRAWLEPFLEEPSPPTAFFALGDVFAIGILSALRDLGYSVPEDVSVIGFDDTDISSVTNPPLTTVHVYKRMMGKMAVDRLLERVEGDDRPATRLRVGTDLVVRESVGQVRGDLHTRRTEPLELSRPPLQQGNLYPRG